MSTAGSGKCIIISAPSGAGKTSIVRHLLKRFATLSFSVSATSRPPRADERDGVHYYFLSPEEFKSRITAGDFLEWEEVYPNRFYGTLKSEIQRVWSTRKHLIFDLDVIGGINLKAYFGRQALSLFIQPPDLATLEQRLRSRNTESEATLAERLGKAARELSYATRFDCIVVNDVLEDACAEAEALVAQFIEA